MKSATCSSCTQQISPNDKFCQHCGAEQKPKVAPKIASDEPKVQTNENYRFSDVIVAILLAGLTGIVFGYLRYWIGYYILIQGVIAAVVLAYFVKAQAANKLERLANVRFKMSLLLFVGFVLAQAVGYGLAQPVFDPFNWFARVWNGDSSESVFGIFSTAGVVSRTFSEGVSGGFWLLLTAIDLFFMFFILLVSMPLSTKK